MPTSAGNRTILEIQSGTDRVASVISYPPLPGMSYPRLVAGGAMRVVSDYEEISSLPDKERKAARVLLTSASVGCPVRILDALPNLAFVISQGAGADRIDIAGLGQQGVCVRCVGETLTEDVADLAMALITMSCRDLVRADAFARSGAWKTERFGVRDSIVGMTLGIAGLSGRIGQAIAARARVSRMEIAGLARASNQGLASRLHEDWAALASASDVLVLAVPGTPDLRHVIGREELRKLGPRGRLVNVGRGSLVDTEALIEALEDGTIAGAALDVVGGEPDIPSRLAALPNVIVTPHVGGQTWGQRARSAMIIEDEILVFIAGLRS